MIVVESKEKRDGERPSFQSAVEIPRGSNKAKSRFGQRRCVSFATPVVHVTCATRNNSGT